MGDLYIVYHVAFLKSTKKSPRIISGKRKMAPAVSCRNGSLISSASVALSSCMVFINPGLMVCWTRHPVKTIPSVVAMPASTSYSHLHTPL